MENDDYMLYSDDDLDDFSEDEEQIFKMGDYVQKKKEEYFGEEYSSAFSYSYLENYEGGRDDWDEKKEKVIAEATEVILNSLTYIFEEDEETLNTLIKSIIDDIVREQLEKQHLYGVFFLNREGGCWRVPYTKYRSVDECENTYLTAEEKSYYAKNNYGLIHSVCHKYMPAGGKTCKFTYDDLFEAGLEGLTKALNTYVKNGNIKFSTYATNCIQNTVIDVLRKHMNISVMPPISLEQHVFEDETGKTVGDNLPDENSDFSDDVEKDNILIKLRGVIKEIIDGMDEGPAYVITHFFGIFEEEKLTKLEIMKRLSLSKSAYAKFYNSALNSLKEGFLDRGIDFSDFADIFT